MKTRSNKGSCGACLIAGLLAGFIALLAFVVADMVFGHNGPERDAVVVSRNYEPSHTTVSTGTAIDPNGNLYTTVSTNHEAEKWTVIISVDGSVVSSKAATPEVWAACEEKQHVSAREWLGGITGAGYGWTVTRAGWEGVP